MQASFFKAHIRDTGPNYNANASVFVLIVLLVMMTQAVLAATMRAIVSLLNLLTCTWRNSLLMKSWVTLWPQTSSFYFKTRTSVDWRREVWMKVPQILYVALKQVGISHACSTNAISIIILDPRVLLVCHLLISYVPSNGKRLAGLDLHWWQPPKE